MTDQPLVGLTIYLVKEGKEDLDACIKDREKLKTFPVEDTKGAVGTLFVQNRKAQPPSWGKFFEPGIRRDVLGSNSSTAGVLHVVVDKRAFLLTFGQGRYLIEPNCYEERFGLRVTLNSIAEDQVRQIDKHTLGVGRHSKVQMNKASAPSEFGLDIERDLLRGMTGTPTEAHLGKTLSGVDSLHALVETKLSKLKALLSDYLEQYGKATYKKTFPWVDHIAEVKDKAAIEHLDGKVLELVRKKDWSKCWLAVPEVIEWDIAGFRHRRGKKYPRVHDMDFKSFLDAYKFDDDDITIDVLKSKEICAEDGNDQEKYAWSVYRCIYAELDYNKNTYILSDQRWYRIAPNFVQQVDAYFASISRSKLKFPAYADASEGEYNTRVVAEGKGVHALMDRKMIHIGGGRSQIEFCDVLTSKREMVHVKHYGGAGMLSHLFAQGVVAGQLFLGDKGFRDEVNKLLPASHRISNTADRPDPGKYSIVFAIISKDASTNVTLPFFSRLNARQAIQTLADVCGYQASLLFIPTGPAAAKTKKYKTAAAKGAKKRR